MVGLTFPRSGREPQARGARPTVIRTPAKALPTHDAIAARAYEIYVNSGRQEGRCEENWLRAEHELLEEAIASEEEETD